MLQLTEVGADLAFDERTLTNYFASRSYALCIFLIANSIKTAFAYAKSLLTPTFALQTA